jgi:shikimate kinase
MRPQARSNVFLVGFMASGKTALGCCLARLLGWRFMDTDAEIESKQARSIAEIFTSRGEVHFRRLEAQALARAARGQHQVVATGGGAVMDPKNTAAMRKSGVILYLEIPFEQLFKRAQRRGGTIRPLWRAEKPAQRRRSMARLYALRRPLYRAVAHITLRTAGGTPRQVAAQVLSRLLKGGWIRP